METDSKLSDLAAIFKKYPQAYENVSVGSKPPLESMPKVMASIKESQAKLGNSGRVLVRYSGTEMLCRVMVEGPKVKEVHQMAKTIAKAIENEIGS